MGPWWRERGLASLVLACACACACVGPSAGDAGSVHQSSVPTLGRLVVVHPETDEPLDVSRPMEPVWADGVLKIRFYGDGPVIDVSCAGVQMLALGTRKQDGSFGSLLGQDVGHDLGDFFALLEALSLCPNSAPLTAAVAEAALKKLDTLPDPDALQDEHYQEPDALPPLDVSDIPTLALLPDKLESMRLCLIGDTGSGKAPQYAVATALKQRNCTHLFVLGDVIYGHGLRHWNSRLLKLCGNRWFTKVDMAWMLSPCSRFTEKFLAPYQELIDAGVEVLVAVGNHDYGVRSLGQIGDALARGRVRSWLNVANSGHPTVDRVHFPYPFYVVTNPSASVCVFVLDTEEMRNAGSCRTQRDWLRKRMAELRATCKFSIAVGHTPSRTSGAHGCAEGTAEVARLPFRTLAFWEAEVLGKVDLEVAGHDHHMAYEGKHQGTPVFVVGSGGGGTPRPLLQTPYIVWPPVDRLPGTPCSNLEGSDRQDCIYGFMELDLETSAATGRVSGNATIFGSRDGSAPQALFQRTFEGAGLREVGTVRPGDACSAKLRRCKPLEDFLPNAPPATRSEL